MAYASTDDVVALWAKEPEPEVLALIARRLEQVERMILRKIPDLADRIADDEIDVQDVITIESDAVLRVVRNPDGMRSEADGAYSYELSREAADNTLRILPEEWKILGIIEIRKMFTIAPRLWSA